MELTSDEDRCVGNGGLAHCVSVRVSHGADRRGDYECRDGHEEDEDGSDHLRLEHSVQLLEAADGGGARDGLVLPGTPG